MRQHIGVNFHEKSFITLSILLVFKPNLVPRCALHCISLVMHAKFEGNPILCLNFMAVFLWKCEKNKRKKKRKWATFWRLIFQEWLAWFTSDLVCVFSQYASTCTANSVLFGQETMELQMRVKSYFVLCVNKLYSRCACTPCFLGAHNKLPCVLIRKPGARQI